MLTYRDMEPPQKLNYMGVAPVRGQLETDSRVAPGWRYLQCTDTPGELKVLLPPNTSRHYAELLLAERDELGKGHISSTTLIDIRRLKERMIRKCHRLSNVSTKGPKNLASFQTVTAPEDFRLKEMERWLQDSFLRSHAADPNLRRQSGSSRRNSGTSYGGGGRSSRRTSYAEPTVIPNIVQSSPIPPPQDFDDSSWQGKDGDFPSPVHEPQANLHTIDEERSELGGGMRPDGLMSPEPLPVRMHSEPPVSPGFNPEILPPHQREPASPPGEPLEFPRPHFLRRKSSLKGSNMRGNSGDSLRTVSFFGDGDLQEQMSKYQNAAVEVEAAGKEFSVLRSAFRQKVDGLDVNVLRDAINTGAQRISLLRQELEQAEAALRHQTEILEAVEDLYITEKLLDDKEKEYGKKVDIALHESKNVLALAGSKREAHREHQ